MHIQHGRQKGVVFILMVLPVIYIWVHSKRKHLLNWSQVYVVSIWGQYTVVNSSDTSIYGCIMAKTKLSQDPLLVYLQVVGKILQRQSNLFKSYMHEACTTPKPQLYTITWCPYMSALCLLLANPLALFEKMACIFHLTANSNKHDFSKCLQT